MTTAAPPTKTVLKVDSTWSDVDVLSIAECAKRLDASRVDVEAGLRQVGILSKPPFGARVVWGAVVRALDPATAQPAASGKRTVRLPPGAVPIP
jgi:hypothetical protein